MTSDPERGNKQDQEGEVFDRQYQVYKESYVQRGLSEEAAEQAAAGKLETGQGEPGGAHRDRD